ncbi:xylan 1,4-beta-xylosidase, partial [Streptomyces sp. J2-1]|nr:xylan 1,4-beta-xylosidase [Streptomyces corallincola]
MRRRPPAALLGAGAAVLALLAALVYALPGASHGEGRPPAPGASGGPSVGWGFTHTQYSADQGSGTAVERARRLLADGGGLAQGQAIMGWGADNPEPRKGSYDFAALDRRGGGGPPPPAPPALPP